MCFSSVSFAGNPDIEQWRLHCQGKPQGTVQAWLTSTSKKAEWLGLTHFFDSSTSDAYVSDFFVARDGKERADHELEATVCEMLFPTRKIGPLKLDAACAFPARKFWFHKIGVPVSSQGCSEFEDFFAGIAPQNLTYVYSSAYPNNPASMFGHTFIRVNQGNQDPLLDYGVNYAALVPEGEPGYIYVPLGLLGLYPGIFQIGPYYRKVLEYTQAESRDLWEYDLNFTREETEQWVRHIFELRFLAKFSYSFARQNCSYQLIRSLQAVKPSFVGQIGNGIYVLPGHTVREIQKIDPNAVGAIKYRPSLYKILQSRFSQLNPDEQARFQALSTDPSQIANEKDPKVLETLISFYDHQKMSEQDLVKPETADNLRKTRVTRAKLGGKTDFVSVAPSADRTNQPDLGHDTRTIGVFFNRDTFQKLNAFGLSFRLGLHDLVDRDLGYEPTFSVTGLSAEVQWSKEKQFELNRAQFVEIISLQPIESTQFPFSWNLGSGFDRVPFAGLSGDTAWNVYGGPGVTFSLIRDHLYSGLFTNVEFWLEHDLSRHFQLFAVPEPWVLFRLTSGLKFFAKMPIRIRYDGSKSYVNSNFEGAWSYTKNSQIRLSLQTLDPEGVRVQASMLFFF